MRKLLSLIILLFILSSCGTTTKVTGSWTKIGYEPQQFNKIAVLGIGAVSENRRIFEDEVETRLEAKGYPVIAALDLLPPNAAIGTISREVVRDIFISADKYSRARYVLRMHGRILQQQGGLSWQVEILAALTPT